MNHAPIRIIFFDVGGTLLHPDPSFHGLVAHVCQRHGVEVTAEDAERVEPDVWARIAQRDDGGRGFSVSADRSREFWLWVYRTFLRELGHTNAAESDLPQQLLDTFLRLESYRLYGDSIPALRALSDGGFTLGIISNWEAWLDRLMVRLGIERFFGVAMISGKEGLEKPDPAIFLRALERAGVRPEEAVHIGDSIHDDVQGARAIGMRGILLDRGGRQSGQTSDYPSIRGLDELPSLLGLGPDG
jgi:putative hydrolase of the HAD superfamily